jgi:hypothetical protein
MGYKPKLGDLVEIHSKWHPEKQVIGVITKINKNAEWNGTVNIKIVFGLEDDREMKAVYIGDIKLLSKAS